MAHSIPALSMLKIGGWVFRRAARMFAVWLLTAASLNLEAAPEAGRPLKLSPDEVRRESTNQNWWMAKGLRVVTYEFLEQSHRSRDLSAEEILAILDRLGGCDLVLLKGFHYWQGRLDESGWGYPRFRSMAEQLIPKLHARGIKAGIFGFTDRERSYGGGPDHRRIMDVWREYANLGADILFVDEESGTGGLNIPASCLSHCDELRKTFKLPVGLFLYGPASQAAQVDAVAQHVDVIGEMGYNLFLDTGGDYSLKEVTRRWSQTVKGAMNRPVAYWTGAMVTLEHDRQPGSSFWRERFGDRTIPNYFAEHFRQARDSGADGVFFHSLCRLSGLPTETQAEVEAALRRAFRQRNAQLSTGPATSDAIRPDREVPTSEPRTSARYVCEQEDGLPSAVVRTFSIGWGGIEQTSKGASRWLFLQATKVGGEQLRVWLLTAGYPPDGLSAATRGVSRFIVQRGDTMPLEFRDRRTGQAVLPTLGGWHYLLPRSVDSSPLALQESFPKTTEYLGHRYRLGHEAEHVAAPPPPNATVIELRPDVLVGVPSNTRQQEGTRRYDGSDYRLRRLTREDFHEMAEAGINCLRVDAEQRNWVEDLAVFYWGIGGQEAPYPECFYDSRYLGPVLFLDEPAVHTRDYVIRPKLAKDDAFRKGLTIEIMLEAFRETFDHAWREGAPTSFIQGLAARPDVDLGSMKFRQANLFSWETMVSTAGYQLSQDPEVPAAMVLEPPGRVGTLRTLPEFDMSYGCQIPVDDPKALADILYGFLRGAARLTGKQWGTSIYGAVDRADAPWFLTHAYDLGATRFFFWDNAGLACVPYQECLGLARQLKMRVENRPERDLEQLRRAAEVLILLPPGYNLGHVQLGRGSLWGLGELNLERTNRCGIKYREVMGNCFTEIERCLRLGVAFDLLWDLPGAQTTGYREIVCVREDGKVEVAEDGKRSVLDHARGPVRPSGPPPVLEVGLSTNQGSAPLRITARAQVTQTSAPVYYALGTDNKGIYHNAAVAWELYGPGEEDYRSLASPGVKPQVRAVGERLDVTIEFGLNRSGKYRLRAAAVDVAGRSIVHWIPIIVTE